MRFSIIVLSLVLFSCVTEKQRAKICTSCQHTDSTYTFTKDTIIKHDTLIFLSQVGDTITIPCAEKDTVIVRKNKGIRTEVRYVNGQVKCICSDDSLKLVISKIRTDHFAEIDSIKNEKFFVQCDKKHHTGWDTFGNYCAWILIVSVLLIIVYFVARLYKPNVKF